MYYLAEFLNYYPLLRQKLALFINNKRAGFCFNYCHMPFTEKSWEYLFLMSDIPWPQNWYIYGICTANFSLGNIPQLPMPYMDGITLLECDRFLHWFAQNHDWAIIPWGSCTPRLDSFLFISRQKKLRDSFVNNCSNINSIQGYYFQPVDTNLSIVQYDVDDKFSRDSCCVIIDESSRKMGNLLWKACNLNDRNLPWVIASYHMEGDDDEPPFDDIENKDFRYIKTLDFTIDPMHPQRLGIYEPNSRASLMAMLQIRWQNPHILLVVSNDTNLESLAEILKKTEHYNSYSDLSFVREIISMGEWFYKLDTDRNDYKYSLLVSRNHEFIQNIDRYCKDNADDRAIAYF
jgi:hypothetical protein